MTLVTLLQMAAVNFWNRGKRETLRQIRRRRRRRRSCISGSASDLSIPH
jgi:heme exporter protein D